MQTDYAEFNKRQKEARDHLINNSYFENMDHERGDEASIVLIVNRFLDKEPSAENNQSSLEITEFNTSMFIHKLYPFFRKFDLVKSSQSLEKLIERLERELWFWDELSKDSYISTTHVTKEAISFDILHD